MMECDVCGDEMDDEYGNSLNGVEISVAWENDKLLGYIHPEYKKLLDTFGKTKFAICFVCWIKSLGVKPIK